MTIRESSNYRKTASPVIRFGPKRWLSSYFTVSEVKCEVGVKFYFTLHFILAVMFFKNVFSESMSGEKE